MHFQGLLDWDKKGRGGREVDRKAQQPGAMDKITKVTVQRSDN